MRSCDCINKETCTFPEWVTGCSLELRREVNRESKKESQWVPIPTSLIHNVLKGDVILNGLSFSETSQGEKATEATSGENAVKVSL